MAAPAPGTIQRVTVVRSRSIDDASARPHSELVIGSLQQSDMDPTVQPPGLLLAPDHARYMLFHTTMAPLSRPSARYRRTCVGCGIYSFALNHAIHARGAWLLDPRCDCIRARSARLAPSAGRAAGHSRP